jgi:hypothetical protein
VTSSGDEYYLAETGVKLAPWQFFNLPRNTLLPAAQNPSPAQVIEQTHRRLLQETHPEVDWDLIHQKKFNR